jgi:fructosamine-3-kinase
MDAQLREVLSDCLGAAPRSGRAVSGGDIDQSMRVECEDGTTYFVKRYSEAGMPEAEARGLRWLAEAGVIHIPEVIAALAAPLPIIVLEWIEAVPPARDFDENLGRSLAALHQSGADGFGFAADNFIGRLPQSNRSRDCWVEFYASERIAPQIRMGRRSGVLSSSHEKRAEALIERLPELCGPPEPPSRLHGDLWGGNLMVDGEGQPCLIDPAVYGGHREMDLDMMRLFGGFGGRVFDAYAEVAPLAPGYEERVDLYQLYPVLVHVNLFGGGYVESADRILRHYTR